MRAEKPKKTIVKGYLEFIAKDMGITVPIFVYKKNVDFDKLERHMYHSADHGRIRYERHCEKCGQNVFWEDISFMTENGEGLVEITKEEIEAVFNKTENTISVISPIRLADFGQKDIWLKNLYSITPYRADLKRPPRQQDSVLLATIFAALEANKMGLLVSTSVDQIQRYAVMLPSGDMWTLYYEEEIREDIPIEAVPEKQLLTGLRSFLKTREIASLTEPFSLANMRYEMDQIVNSKATAVPGEAAKQTTAKFEEITEALRVSIKKTAEKKVAKTAKTG